MLASLRLRKHKCACMPLFFQGLATLFCIPTHKCSPANKYPFESLALPVWLPKGHSRLDVLRRQPGHRTQLAA